MAGYDELKIQVGFQLDNNVGSQLEKELAALSKARDFKIDAQINISDKDIKSLSNLERVLERFNNTSTADINKIHQVGKAFSSINIDESVIANIDKVQKSLESFAKLSVDLQRKLSNVSMFEGTESELKGVTMNMKQFDEQVQKTLSGIQKGIKGSSESLTGYVNAQKGTVEVLVEKLNDVYKVTKNIDASGNVIGKVTGNVDGYVNSIGNAMKQNYNKLLQYQNQYYKAVADQDKDMVMALDNVMDYYTQSQKRLTKELDDNGLGDYAKKRIDEIEKLHALQGQISEVKGMNLLDKQQLKDDEKALKTFIKQYDDVVKDLKKYEPQLLGAESKGNKNEIDFLKDRVNSLKDTKETLETMIPSFKNWEQALKEFEKKDTQLQDRIKQKMAQIEDQEKKKNDKKVEKTEKDNYDRMLKEYKDVTSKINQLAQEQRKALDGGNQETFKKATNEIKEAELRKKALQDEMRTLKDYERIKKEIASIDKKNRDSLNLADAKRKDTSLTKSKKEVEELSNSYEKLGKAINENLNKASKLKDNSLLKDTNIDKIYSELNKISNISFDNLGKADVDNLMAKVEKLSKSLKELEDVKLFNKKSEMNNLKVDKLESEFKSLEAQIRQTFGNAHAESMISDLNQLRQAANKSGDEFDIMGKKWANSMDDVKRAMKSVKGDMVSSSGGGFFTDFYDNLFMFTAGELLAEGIQNVGRAMKDLVMEYDHAMTNLKKVADPADIMNMDQLDAIQQKAVGIAKNVGMASQDVIQAISDTIQMSGRSMEESIIIAEQTMMLANVAEMTQEAASQGIVTMMSAFNLDPLKQVPVLVDGVTKSTTELSNAMDMVNYVGNNFSISSEGIVNALQKGGAVLAQYGVSMADTIALTAGANKVLQDPEVVGNGLRYLAC